MKKEFAVLLMEGTDYFSQELNCQKRFPSVLLSFSFWLNPSLLFRLLLRYQSLNIGDQITSLCHWLSNSLLFELLFKYQNLDIGDQNNFLLPLPPSDNAVRVKAKVALKRQISNSWPTSDSFAKIVLF